MIDITSVLGLQGRARRNAKASLRRLQRQRAEAVEAASALTEAHADAAGAPLPPPAQRLAHEAGQPR